MSINRTDEERGSCQRDGGEDRAAPGKRQGLGNSGVSRPRQRGHEQHTTDTPIGLGRLFCAEEITPHTPKGRDRRSLGCRESTRAIPVAGGAMFKAKQFQHCAETVAEAKATKADDDAASLTVHAERVGTLQSDHDFLVAQAPHKMIRGGDWLWKLNVFWDFKECTLCIKEHKNIHRLLREDYNQGNTSRATEDSKQLMLEGDRKAATDAHQQMASAVRRMGAERAVALIRPAPKRYKDFRNRGKLIPIRQLLKTVRQKEQDGKVNQLMEIHFVRTVEEKSAGIEEVCAAAKDTHMKIGTGSAYGEAPGDRVKMCQYYGEPEVVTPISSFEEWRLDVGVDCQESIKRIQCAHKQLFVDQLPARLPPEGVVNHTIMLLSGKMTTMVVGKKDDGFGKQQYRMVINYHELNAIKISSECPLPRIQDILDLLRGAKVFSTMDMEQGFHQIRMAPEDQHKTAFRTCIRNYEFKLLDQVLKTLWEYKMYRKFKKCQFGTLSIEYLGHRIAGDGIAPTPTKIKAIEVWPGELHNDKQVKQFFDTVNYCRMFMGPAFADIARPLVELTKKDAPFVWTGKHTAAVKALKHTLVNYTTLQTPDMKKPYVLRTDASGYAVGGVLEQDGKPLGFMSMKMSPAEQRYSVYDQELLALIRALEKWRQLLLVATVTAYTDHRALQYLTKMKTTKPIRPRVARWLEFLTDFQHLKVEYRPGANNVVADALSRCPYYQPVEAETLRDAANDTAEMGSCFLVQATDEDLQEIQGYTKALTPLQEAEKDRQWKIRVGGSWRSNALQECNEFSTSLTTVLNHNQQPVMAQTRGKQHGFKLSYGASSGPGSKRASSWHPQNRRPDREGAPDVGAMLRCYIQAEEQAWEKLVPAAELPYNCTIHTSTGLIPFEVMISENPLRASEIELVGEFSPTWTPPMTKIFKQPVDRATFNIPQASKQGKSIMRTSTEEKWEGQDSPTGYAGARRLRSASEAEDEVEHLLDNKGEGKNEEFLVKWKGFSESAAIWEPTAAVVPGTTMHRT
ncbi:OSJNBa0061C08.12 protein, related [Eimeria brunetti]|uniref:OSJNBa0061C08.12 protein, related n=1 Tax=Eimeria brunetti TaxID=51314 RepID=U6LKU0_9EIME|nr:OSJNBa0061C08.12 protein, related [Eimeria brunetti]